AKADAAAILAQVFDCQPEPARSRGPKHQPVGASREVFLRQGFAKHLIINAEVLYGHAALRHSGRAASLENVDGQTGEAFGHPAANRASPQPVVLKGWEFSQILEAVDFLSGTPPQLGGELQPERASGLRTEMPLDDLPHVRI